MSNISGEHIVASYIHRDERGIAKATYDAVTSLNIFNAVPGHFEQRTYPNTGKKTVFVVDQDRTLTTFDPSVVIFFWAGDVLIPR